MTLPPWLYVLFAGIALVGAFFAGQRWQKRRHRRSLPKSWPLMGRPVLNSDERRTMRVLREALPQHIVLAKLPLVRLCQPRDPRHVRYWFDLLATINVSFAVCSPSGRVLAVVDIEPESGVSRRVVKIKTAVLEACRIRYLSCKAESLPPIGELQLLLRQPGSTPRQAPLAPSPHFLQARSTLSDTVRLRRAERSARWGDSGFPQDSFFAPDSRIDAAPSEFAPISGHSLADLPDALR